ncbi:MAG: DHA2 family efflux MFS transporter permease subunit [Desulfobacterota bacterium]|jgi:DHA2 family multidrug resistance protein|nr:DHA2 family efflux MFS transporter permease subunit [Thermodesulfobacteriota bacterium]
MNNPPAPIPQVNKWLVTVTVMLPTIIEILDMSVANVALGHMQGSLSAGLDEITWVLTSYLVANAIIIPITGWLSATFGRKNYLVFSLGLFTFSSLMCGAAPNLETLILFRVLQGLGGGALQPLALSILLETFPPRQHGMAMAVYGIGIVFGPILGPLLGGYITDNLSWRWIFYINLPLGGLAILMALLFIFDPAYIRRAQAGIDYWGLGLLCVGLGALQVVLDRGEREDWFASNFIVGLSVMAVVCLTLFVRLEWRHPSPVVRLQVFKNRSFTTGNLIMFFCFFAFFGSIVLLPLYLQNLMGYTAYLAGLVLGPGGISTLIMMPLVGRLIGVVDARLMLAAGMLINALALYLMSAFTLTTDFWSVIWPRILQGVGISLFFVPLSTLTLSSLSKPEMGNGSAIFNLLRNLGGSFGVAFITTVLSRRAQFHQGHLSEGFSPYDFKLQQAQPTMQQYLQGAGLEATTARQGSLELLYRQLQQQAAMLSFNDVFWLLSLFFLGLVPFIVLIRRRRDAIAQTGT